MGSLQFTQTEKTLCYPLLLFVTHHVATLGTAWQQQSLTTIECGNQLFLSVIKTAAHAAIAAANKNCREAGGMHLIARINTPRQANISKTDYPS
jgi:hypothetical protein